MGGSGYTEHLIKKNDGPQTRKPIGTLKFPTLEEAL